MSSQKKSSRLEGKDLITIGIYTVIYVVIVMLVAMLGFIPIFIPLMAVLCPLIGGIPYMLYVTKAKKFGMTAIMGFLIGLIMVFFGNGYLTMVTGLVGGLLADVILKKADYKSAKSTVLSCGVFSIWVFGNFAPIFLNRESYMVMLTEGYGAEYAATLNTYMPMWIAPIRGTDIRDVPLAELMEQISMVFQRVYLFQDTIYNNISMGKPDATEEEVYEAAKKARCYDFIMALPDGFQTVIGEGGATLSGGEKQRISIARCILKDAPIVILDEATASVDTDNESYIQEAINELVKGKTLLVIAHRLNTIRQADQILVISDGRISEQGTHDELMAKAGIYQDFVNIRKKSSGWSLA